MYNIIIQHIIFSVIKFIILKALEFNSKIKNYNQKLKAYHKLNFKNNKNNFEIGFINNINGNNKCYFKGYIFMISLDFINLNITLNI